MVVFFATALTSLLNFAKYRLALMNLVRSRYEVTLSDLKSTIENGLDLGLSLDESTVPKMLLQKVVHEDETILSAHIFTLANGRAEALFNAGQPTAWKDKSTTRIGHAIRSASNVWRQEDDGTPFLGVVLRGSFDQPMGAVILRYSQAYIDRKSEAVFAEIFRFGTLALLIAGCAVVLGAVLLLERIGRAFRRMTHNLAMFCSTEELQDRAENSVFDHEPQLVRFLNGARDAASQLQHANALIHKVNMKARGG